MGRPKRNNASVSDVRGSMYANSGNYKVNSSCMPRCMPKKKLDRYENPLCYVHGCVGVPLSSVASLLEFSLCKKKKKTISCIFWMLYFLAIQWDILHGGDLIRQIIEEIWMGGWVNLVHFQESTVLTKASNCPIVQIVNQMSDPKT